MKSIIVFLCGAAVSSTTLAQTTLNQDSVSLWLKHFKIASANDEVVTSFIQKPQIVRIICDWHLKSAPPRSVKVQCRVGTGDDSRPPSDGLMHVLLALGPPPPTGVLKSITFAGEASAATKPCEPSTTYCRSRAMT
jgi:hypothetical protein